MKTIDPGLPPSTRLIAEGALDHPECVIWDVTQGVLFAGGEDGQIYRVALQGDHIETVTHQHGSFFLGLALDEAGNLFACDMASGHVIRVTQDGGTAPYGDVIGTPNYPIFAPDGTLYVSESGIHNGHNGRIMRILPDGTTTEIPLTRPLAFANGLALRGEMLYVVESDAARVARVCVEGGDPEIILTLPGTVPDGLAFDTEGAMWVACYQPNRIYRVTADGHITVPAEDPGGWMLPMPTNICFAGDDLMTVVASCLGGWFLTAFDAPCPGLAATRPALPRKEALA